jgi:hypothetical protein
MPHNLVFSLPGSREEIGTELVAEGEHEALFYWVRGRNAVLLTWSGQGRLSIRKIAVDVPPVVGTPGWELIDGKARELAWELICESDLAVDAELSLHWGVVAAALGLVLPRSLVLELTAHATQADEPLSG